MTNRDWWPDQLNLRILHQNPPRGQRVMHPRHHNLFFIALVQPLCAIMPLAEEQSKWVAAMLAGDYALPPQAEIDRETRSFHDGMKQGYLPSPRHTIQINDCAGYAARLRRELRRGQRARAAAGRHRQTASALAARG